MTLKPFQVSIQWNKGMHYFQGGYGFDTEEAAISYAEFLQQDYRKRLKGRPGARPTIRIWKLINEIPFNQITV